MPYLFPTGASSSARSGRREAVRISVESTIQLHPRHPLFIDQVLNRTTRYCIVKVIYLCLTIHVHIFTMSVIFPKEARRHEEREVDDRRRPYYEHRIAA